MILQHPSTLGHIPQRIVSLVPSQTELLHYLGLENETVGITKFCIHPREWHKTKTRVGGTKSVNFSIMHQLDPDLVIANKEENIKEQVEELAADYPVWVTDVDDLDAAIQMITDIGELTGKQTVAASLSHSIRYNFHGLKQLPAIIDKPRAAYLIWKNPYMTVGGDTFIDDMLNRCGLVNVFAGRHRYPETCITELASANCQLILLASEPYPFEQKHAEELSALLPSCKIMLVNGEYFSWYGSRLLEAPGYFKELIKHCS